MSKKNKSKVTIEFKRFEEGESKEAPGLVKKKLEESEKEVDMSKPGQLVNRADFPVTVKYDESLIRLSPRQRVAIGNWELVKDKPNIVTLIKK